MHFFRSCASQRERTKIQCLIFRSMMRTILAFCSFFPCISQKTHFPYLPTNQCLTTISLFPYSVCPRMFTVIKLRTSPFKYFWSPNQSLTSLSITIRPLDHEQVIHRTQQPCGGRSKKWLPAKLYWADFDCMSALFEWDSQTYHHDQITHIPLEWLHRRHKAALFKFESFLWWHSLPRLFDDNTATRRRYRTSLPLWLCMGDLFQVSAGSWRVSGIACNTIKDSDD